MTNNNKQHGEIMHELGGIASDICTVKEHLKTLNGKVIAHEKSINKIHLSRAKEKGVIIGVSSVVSLVWAFITKQI